MKDYITVFIVALIASVIGGAIAFTFAPAPILPAHTHEESTGGVTNFDALTLDNGDLTITNGGITASGETVVQGFTEGGGTVTVTPVTSTVTLTQANLLAGNVITFTASTTMPALTVTLPATSTMTTLLASDGNRRNWVIENPFTAAATTTTIAAGTGVDLQEPDGQNVVIGINNYAWLTCFREASTDVVCSISETIPAD
jgi:hypothetical protein